MNYQKSCKLCNEWSEMTVSDFFQFCVYVLQVIGEHTGLGYELANIIIFVFVQPMLILLFAGLWLRLKYTTT